MLRCSLLVLLLAAVPLVCRAAPELYLAESVAREAQSAQLRATATELEAIYADLAQASGVDAILVWSTAADINAFATMAGDDKIVVVQEGLLDAFNGDRDAVAAVLAHELAHHQADHLREGKRKREGVQVLGAILGAVVGAQVGKESGELAGALAGTAVGVGSGLLVLKFSRNQELEADRLAVGWMIAAGYNPDGMLRLQTALGELGGKRSASILSTHPTSAKRYKDAQKQIAKLAPEPELLAAAVTPLVQADDLAKAEADIANAKQEQLAAALKPSSAEVSAAALAPIEGISLDTYAAISNQLVQAGESGRTKVLSRHGLDATEMDRVNQGYMTRMRAEPALMQRYSVAYFRATQGKLAAWGRDLADSYENGQPLKLDPPYSMAQAKTLLAALSARGAPQLDEAGIASAEKDVLGAYGLSYYDFQIGHNWWSRQLKIEAMAGDSAPLQDYYSAMQTKQDASRSESAEASGVHIGKGVKIGNNVKIGGEPVSADSDSPRD